MTAEYQESKMAAKPKRNVRRPAKKAAARSRPTAKKRRKLATKAHKRAAGTTKIDAVVSALRAPAGASITDLMALTGWQMHSVRGAIAGTLKKKRGLAVISAKRDGERIYRLACRP
jgi:hypothetical protein